MKPDSFDDSFFTRGNDPRKRMYGFPSEPSLAPHQLSVEEELDGETVQVSPERRKKLQRYVKLTVAGCSALCLLALVRGTIAHFSANDEPAVSAQASSPPLAATTLAAVPPAESLPTSATATAPAPIAERKSAKEERDTAQRALEHGHAKDAVEAASRATALEPTDAAGWLLLGAAQQELGHAKESRAAFMSCVRLGKRGSVRECRAMLR